MKRIVMAAAAAGLMLSWSSTTHAGVTVIVEEVGGDVVATGDGSLDLSLVSFNGPIGTGGLIGENRIGVGPNGTADLFIALFVKMQPSSPFGTAGLVVFADSGTGDLFGIQDIGSLLFFFVPTGYTSGQPLEGTATFIGESLTTLGLTPGTYRWEWDTSAIGVTDFFEIAVIAPPVGACCVGDGCLPVSAATCLAAGGQYFGDGVLCGSVACPAEPVTGACCIGDGCVTTVQAECEAAGGTYIGDEVECVSANCPTLCLADIVDSGTFLPPPDGIVDGADLAFLLGEWGRCD